METAERIAKAASLLDGIGERDIHTFSEYMVQKVSDYLTLNGIGFEYVWFGDYEDLAAEEVLVKAIMEKEIHILIEEPMDGDTIECLVPVEIITMDIDIWDHDDSWGVWYFKERAIPCPMEV